MCHLFEAKSSGVFAAMVPPIPTGNQMQSFIDRQSTTPSETVGALCDLQSQHTLLGWMTRAILDPRPLDTPLRRQKLHYVGDRTRFRICRAKVPWPRILCCVFHHRLGQAHISTKAVQHVLPW